MSVPEAIRRAIEEARPVAAKVGTGPISAGDIRLVSPLPGEAGVRRHALIVGEIRDGRSFEVLLLHPYVELATDCDAIFAAAETGLGYEIVVQSDIRGVVWSDQIGGQLGALSGRDLEAIEQLAIGESADAVELSTGYRLTGALDSRWVHKSAEIDAIQLLARDCTESLLFGRGELSIDPGLFDLERWSDGFEFYEVISEVLDVIESGRAEFTADDLLAISDFDQDARAEWVWWFGPVGGEIFDVFTERMTGLVMGRISSVPAESPIGRIAPARHDGRGGLTAHQVPYLLTASSIWAEPIAEGQAIRFESSSGIREMTVQLVGAP